MVLPIEWISKDRRYAAGILLGAMVFVLCVGNARAENSEMTVIAHAVSGPLSCEIRKSGASGSVQLTGVISSSVPLTGQFHFVVMKSGVSGSSNINQGNHFSVAAGGEFHVGRVTVNVGQGDRAAVELSVNANGGVDCRAKASIEP